MNSKWEVLGKQESDGRMTIDKAGERCIRESSLPDCTYTKLHFISWQTLDTFSEWEYVCVCLIRSHVCTWYPPCTKKIHRKDLTIDLMFWHSLTPVAMPTTAPLFSTFPTSTGLTGSGMGGMCEKRQPPRCLTSVMPLPFPAARDPWTATPRPFNSFLTGLCFHRGLKRYILIYRASSQALVM